MLYLNKYEKDGEIKYEVTKTYSISYTVREIPDDVYYVVHNSELNMCFGWDCDEIKIYYLTENILRYTNVKDGYRSFKQYMYAVSNVEVLLDKSKSHTIPSMNKSIDTKNQNIDHKLEWIKKWMEGVKVQYKLSTTPDDDKQWHNFTEGAFQYLKRSDLHFREAPKYVTLNGITFKTIDSLLKHVKNNYDMS